MQGRKVKVRTLYLCCISVRNRAENSHLVHICPVRSVGFLNHIQLSDCLCWIQETTSELGTRQFLVTGLQAWTRDHYKCGWGDGGGAESKC